jgi:predicted acyl esterase
MKNIFLIAVALIFLGLFNNSFSATRVDFTLTMSDGTILDCTKFIPTGTTPTGGWPAIIFCHGYGGTKEDVMDDAGLYADEGYFTAVYTMRGQGFSTGKSNLISTTEMNDFIQVIYYVKGQSIVNSTRVAATGGSQGGTIPFMAVCNGLSLRCIALSVTSPEIGTSWIENKCVKMTLLWSLSYDTSIVRYNNQVGRYRSWILTDTPEKWDSLAYYMPLNRDFTNKLTTNTTAVQIADVWQDKFFNPYGVIKNLASFTVPYRMYFGTYNAHGADPDPGEDSYFGDMQDMWFSYWLKNDPNGILDSAKFVYAASTYPRISTGWTWQRFWSTSWPPSGVTDVKFYLTPNLKLRTLPSVTSPDTLGFVNDVKDTTMTMEYAVNTEFNGSLFTPKFTKTQLIFETPALVQNAQMVGTPFVNVHYKSNTTKAQFNFQIWEVPSSGTPVLVTRANAMERNITANVIRQLSFWGTSHAHIFKAGNKIRIILTNLDNISNDPFLRTNPYVLPSLKKARNIVYMNSSNPSYVQLPMIGYIPNDVVPAGTAVPNSFLLEQNYPNPFNPSTTIKFGLPSGKSVYDVTVKIYDITGKLIATLVNEQLTPGVYSINWTTYNLPSGTYFYSLVTNNYSESKKMVLTK